MKLYRYVELDARSNVLAGNRNDINTGASLDDQLFVSNDATQWSQFSRQAIHALKNLLFDLNDLFSS